MAFNGTNIKEIQTKDEFKKRTRQPNRIKGTMKRKDSLPQKYKTIKRNKNTHISYRQPQRQKLKGKPNQEPISKSNQK